MRIIGGKFKGRRFYPPATKWPTRPTTDYAKEGLFNILQNNFYFEDLKVLDLFGGTGNHSYEFISRGCTDVTYVDQFGGCIAFVKKTAALLKIESQIKIVRSDVFKFIQRCPFQFDYIFAGPPYALPTIDTIPDRILEKGLLKKDGWLVMEHNPNHEYDAHPNCIDVRKYGKTYFSIFKVNPENDSSEEE